MNEAKIGNRSQMCMKEAMNSMPNCHDCAFSALLFSAHLVTFIAPLVLLCPRRALKNKLMANSQKKKRHGKEGH